MTLAPGQYLVTFVSDANVAAAGTLGAALELGGAALPYAVTAETQDAAGADRITLTAIVTPTTAQPLTVINSAGLEHLHEQHAHHSETLRDLKAHSFTTKSTPLQGAFVISYRLFCHTILRAS